MYWLVYLRIYCYNTIENWYFNSKKMKTMIRKITFTAFAVFFAVSLFAELSVSDTAGFYTINAASEVQTVTATSAHYDCYPTNSAGLPQFWFDCSNTNNWVIDEVNGELQVAKIPSLVGDRYLTSVKEEPYSWWWNDGKKPVLVSDDALTGLTLDFGVKGSKRIMAFNAYTAAGASVASNELANIGTVIAVYFTDWGEGVHGEGGYYGGSFLGGGFGYNEEEGGAFKAGYLCYRNANDLRTLQTEGGSVRNRWIDNPMANSSHTHKSITWGSFWHNGFAARPQHVGFGSGWATVSMMPKVDPYGYAVATGLGMNYTDVKAVSGGFKVSEMLIFDHVISDEDRKKIECYLSAKWFKDEKTARRGVNGNASMGWVRVIKNATGQQAGWDQPFDVPAGEKLTIGRLQGSRATTSTLSGIRKTGEGTLEIGEADKFAGPIKIDGGTLKFSRRTIPAEFPSRPRFHFDASQSDTLVVSESDGTVQIWRDISGDVFKNNSVCLRPDGDVEQPRYIESALGEGLGVVDFGRFRKSSADLCYMRFTTNELEAISKCRFSYDGITTVIALVGAQDGGGNIAGLNAGSTYFSRYSTVPLSYASSFYNPNLVVDNIGHTNCVAWIDGIPANGSLCGYHTPGYQVIALQTPSAELSFIGSMLGGSGGIRIGEIVAYTRVLTEREILDVSAYMMRKWLNREAPGYERFKNDGLADLQNVEMLSQSNIHVDRGVARIGSLDSQDAKVVKTGAGTLEIQKIKAKKLEIQEGLVSFSTGADVDSVCQLAAGASLHLDADDVSSLEFSDLNGTNLVVRWYSKNDRGILAHYPMQEGAGNPTEETLESQRKYSPYIDENVTLNGKRVVDFGPYSREAGGRFLQFSRSFDSVRSAYIVWAPRDDTRGTFFGNAYGNIGGAHNSQFYDYLRSETATNNAMLVVNNGTCMAAINGEIYTNGVAAAYWSVPVPREFMLFENHPAGATHISALGVDRNIDRLAGGIRVAEVILYERTLSEREKIATRNYLMAKWFGAPPQDLPPAENLGSELYTFDVNGSAELYSISVNGNLGISKLNGEGNLNVSGGGTLAVKDIGDYTGTISVAAGTTLKADGMRVPEGQMVSDGLIYWADATYGMTLETNDVGETEICEWRSRCEDGWSAVPVKEGRRPTLVVDSGLGGRKVVDMKLNDREGMVFLKNGETNLLDNIRSVVWLLGSQEGGSYLLGGGTNWNGAGAFHNFMRGRADTNGVYYAASDVILNGTQYWTVQPELFKADWFKNSEPIEPTTTGLSGEWDLISMRLSETAEHPTNADGFAFDGRAIRGSTSYLNNWTGGQRLAEVLIYDRLITEEERISVENYLRRKWGYLGAQKPVNSVILQTETGSNVDLGGKNQYFAEVAGNGTFENGSLTVGQLVADAALTTDDLPIVLGNVAIEANQKVKVCNLSSLGESRRIAIMSCAGLNGAEFARNLSIVGDADDLAALEKYRVKLVVEDGVLYLKLIPYGTVIFLR